MYICEFQLWHGYDLMSTEIIGLFHHKENACKRIKEKAGAYLTYDEQATTIYKSETGSRIDIRPGNVTTEWTRRYFVTNKKIDDE